jgi:predicted ATP-grasp superfamily ATP-dependent carboligase
LAILVTDGNQRSALAAVRALGTAGIPVTVGEQQPRSLAGASRYCTRRVCYPSPTDDSERFLAALIEELRAGPYNLVLPMTDITTQLISTVRDTFPSPVRVPFPGPAQVNLVQDKRRILLLARQLGMDCPETFLLDEAESVEAIAERVRFPVVIKPRFSRYRRNGRWFSGSVRYAHDRQTLVSEYNQIHECIPHPLVQEKIEGEGRGVFLLIWDGELKAAFCHRRIREKPPGGGVSVFSESIAPDEELIEKSFALLKAVGWLGVAMVEFKVDRRDGRPKLMEVNGRFWGSLQLAIDAGVNFPLLLYRLAVENEATKQTGYQAGIKCRWLLGDLDHLWIRLARSNAANGLPRDAPSRLKACVDFMKFFQRGLHYDVWRLNDSRPGWFEGKAYVSEILRKISGSSEARHAD